MSRRPQSFRVYARRRWRVVGLAVVLLCGALLVLTLTDRGHDPMWSARGGPFSHVAISPDGSSVYSLSFSGDVVTGLEARRGSTGELRWQSPMAASRALLEAGDGWVAVATDFPQAFLTVYGDDSSVRFQVPLEGNPRALAGDGPRIVLALQAPNNPVLVFEDAQVVQVHHFSSTVNALDAYGGRLAIGTVSGEVVVLDETGGIVFETTLSMTVRSLRLDASGERLLAGGTSRGDAGDLSGAVAFLEPGLGEDALRWSHRTLVPVTFVDMDAAGQRAIAVEESPPRHRIHGFDTSRAEPVWERALDGEVAQDDSGSLGGAAISPDGRYVAVATLRGPIAIVDMASGRETWEYRSHGTTAVAFAERDGDAFIANGRLAATGPHDALMGFSVTSQPALADLPRTAALLVLLSATAAGLVLGAGYWRRRRT